MSLLFNGFHDGWTKEEVKEKEREKGERHGRIYGVGRGGFIGWFIV